MATRTGKRIVDMVWDDLKPSDLITADSIHNSVSAVLAIGGSTNAVVHLIALARRAGLKLDMEAFDRIARETPLLANIRPSGAYLMEDFYYAGGLPAVLKQLALGGRLKTGARTVNGATIGDNVERAAITNEDVIRPLNNPLVASDSLAVLRGNLAPDGAIIKPPAAESRLHKHAGKAVVFEDYNDMAARIDDPDLDVDENSVLVLKNAGPIGAPGMPEWGQLPIPKKVLAKGIRDMVRVSDARMSGTSYGACVLHVAPESFIGGPLALVRDGDVIELDIPGRRLSMQVSDEELERRRAAWKRPPPRYERGYGRLFSDHVSQANEGCDFDFLERGRRFRIRKSTSSEIPRARQARERTHGGEVSCRRSAQARRRGQRTESQVARRGRPKFVVAKAWCNQNLVLWSFSTSKHGWRPARARCTGRGR